MTAPPPTKLSKLIGLMEAGDWRAALSIANRFPRLGAHGLAIRRGHEAIQRPAFQRALGRDPDVLIADGVAALRERYFKAVLAPDA